AEADDPKVVDTCFDCVERTTARLDCFCLASPNGETEKAEAVEDCHVANWWVVVMGQPNERTLEPCLSLLHLIGETEHEGIGEHPGRRFRHQISWEEVHQSEEANRVREIGAAKCRHEHGFERVVDITGCQEAGNGLCDITSFKEHCGSQTMEGLHLSRARGLQLGTEHLEEERVVAIGISTGS